MGRYRGFSLIEILLSLLILSGSLGILLGGMDVAQKLDRRGATESSAVFFAEREMELARSDLLSGRFDAERRHRPGRFRLPKGWTTRVVRTDPDDYGVVRLQCRVTYQEEEQLTLESHFFLPGLTGGETL